MQLEDITGDEASLSEEEEIFVGPLCRRELALRAALERLQGIFKKPFEKR